MTDQPIFDPADLQAGDTVTIRDNELGTVITGDIYPFGLPQSGWQVWGIQFSSAVPGAPPGSVLFTFDPAHAHFTLCSATRMQAGRSEPQTNTETADSNGS